MSEPTPTPTPTPTPASAATPTPTPAPAASATPAPAPAPTPAPSATATPQPAPTPAPAEVVYSLSLPAESVLETSAVERATTLAKESKLAPDAAQKVLEFAHAETAAFFKKQTEEYTAKVAGWEVEVKADPELGGANLARTQMRGKTVLDKFGDPALVEALNKTGFGNYKPLVRLLDKIGAAMESDRPMGMGNTPAPQKSVADILYPTSANVG